MGLRTPSHVLHAREMQISMETTMESAFVFTILVLSLRLRPGVELLDALSSSDAQQ